MTVTAAGLDLNSRVSEVDRLPNESPISGVSWPAVLAGVAVALSVSMLLLALASGLGFSMVSPWYSASSNATAFTLVAAIGLVVVQWVSSMFGGYITGRLRTKWTGVHTHEVFFRDTANGFLTWALATIVGMALLASAASSIVSGGTHAMATIASGAAQGAGAAAQGVGSLVSRYDVDSLFRADKPAVPTAGGAPDANEVSGEATRILTTGLTAGEVPAADKTYLAQLIASRTGISEADAQKRVDAVIAREQEAKTKMLAAADDARKTAAKVSIYTALSMLIGAFIACAAAAYGGNIRDEH